MQTPQNYHSVSDQIGNCFIVQEYFKYIALIKIFLGCAFVSTIELNTYIYKNNHND